MATAAAGQTISAIGSFMEIGVNIISSGDTNGASKAIINNGISKVVDVIVPGSTPSATKVYNETMKVTKVITKEVMNKGLEFK